MSVVVQSGSEIPPTAADPWNPPQGEVHWLDADPTAVSTSGPSLGLSVDFSVPSAAGRPQLVVVRVAANGEYLPANHPDWQDPDGNLAVTATVHLPEDGAAEDVRIVVPYAAFPHEAGGAVHVEIAVHDPTGPLAAHAWMAVELPDDVDRVPDVLTVTAHTLVALVRAAGDEVSRDELHVIRTLLRDNFDLDPLGEIALRRILRTANEVRHSPETLAEALTPVLPAEAQLRFVNLLYACARADGVIEPGEQAFIDALLALIDVHDHERLGPEALRPCWDELELAPGATWEEVKKAYKQMIRDYHPDRVQSLAAGFQDYATRRTAAINGAYAQLRDALDRPTTVEVELEPEPEPQG